MRAVKQGDPSPSVVRTVTFGGRDWSLGYYAKNNAAQRAQQTAIIVAAIGLALTGIVCGLFGYVAYNNLRLSREIQVRIGFERRLTAVIDELNHRVKNILAVIQSIVTRTLRHGSDMDVVARTPDRPHPCDVERGDAAQRKPVAGRQAAGACSSRARSRMPTASRSTVRISPSARAPRSRCRCCSSSWRRIPTRACRWSASTRTSSRNWEVTGEGPDTIFHFRWEEFNTSAATRREDSDFGLILLDRVAPEALGGTAKRYFTDVSYVYELTAPMETVVDMTERDRTEQISAPVRPAR